MCRSAEYAKMLKESVAIIDMTSKKDCIQYCLGSNAPDEEVRAQMISAENQYLLFGEGDDGLVFHNDVLSVYATSSADFQTYPNCFSCKKQYLCH